VAFAAVHVAALVVYAALYSTAAALPDVVADGAGAVRRAWASPVMGWNLLMGGWLYLTVAGGSYAVRAERQRSSAALLAREAQLTALRARLNPHFLFNALNSVSALVRLDADAADHALDQLGGLLRYALRDGDDLVTLAEEWQFTSRYLEFERLRFGDRLDVSAAYDAGADDVLVPAFALQALVENAVRHGASRGTGTATLEIQAGVVHGQVRLEVTNAVPEPSDRAPAGSRLGLAALEQRLALHFGHAAALATGVVDGRFHAQLVVPAVRA
jgi:two-component system sensor histidine kinase AlgZ